jgi:hypothetical protein
MTILAGPAEKPPLASELELLLRSTAFAMLKWRHPRGIVAEVIGADSDLADVIGGLIDKDLNAMIEDLS